MRKIFLFLFLMPLVAIAQFSDDFSDGDFTQNPTWAGNDTSFQITANQLQSNGPNVANSKIYLSTPSSIINQTEWSFLVDLKFPPTSTTFVRVYLCSDNSDLKASLNGYYIHIGNTNEDYVKFYKQTGTTTTELFTGPTSLGTGNIKVRIKVTRDNTGNWAIYADNTGGYNYTLQGNVTDNSFTSTSYFGVYCEYSTASRYNLYYFDDFYAGPIVLDTIPPQLESVFVVNANRLELNFSEAVSQLSAENTLNYNVSPGMGAPIAAQRVLTDLKKVTLDFASSFILGTNYQLTVYNIEDLSQNLLTSQTSSFMYYVPNTYDVVFNELMVDPSPVVGLPDYEYIELYNRTNAAINLQGWKLKYATTEKILPAAIILPDSFLVITSPSGLSYFSSFGNVISVSGLSTTALVNTGTTLVLSDINAKVIHAVSYTDAWYQDNNKKDGGWSLEQIDPNNPCAGINNWKASKDASGGTLGRKNSIFGVNTDNISPDVIRVGIIDSVTIEVFFSENMLGTTLLNTSNYAIDNNIGQPVQVISNSPLHASVVLKLNATVLPFIKYKITVSDQITDCVGNIISDNNFAYFGIPETVAPNDLIINEVLFNPPTGGVDFVEIYNRSSKIIDLKNIRLCTKDTMNNTLNSLKVISEGSYLIFPNDYKALTTSKKGVLDFYNSPNSKGFVEMASIPSYYNTNGIVVLATMGMEEIDIFVYTEDMHYPLLTDVKGVSLERIHFDRPTSDPTNWHSAAASVGYATPAYKNSQFGVVVQGEDPVTLSPDIFSPDNDGYNDVLNIAYKFSEPGYAANIMIYDARGRQVIYLVKNELLGTEGVFSWDGITEDNLKANVGIYIVYFEIFDVKGNVKKYKKTTVLGGKLK